MRVVLEILDGPLAGRTVELTEGQVVTVGRTAKSQLMLPHDSFLSSQHFAVECRPDGCFARDAGSSNGTWVNGQKITEHALAHGDQLAAGQTRFRLLIAAIDDDPNSRTSTVMFAVPQFDQTRATTGIIPPPSLTPVQQNVLEYLRRAPAPLYVILNANIEERVPQLLMSSGELYQFMPEGLPETGALPPGVFMAAVPVTSLLLPRLIQMGWGHHWLLFFTCMHPFLEVRKYLRQFLLMTSDDGKQFYFRYYDPRLLQFFLPACTPQEITQFFGPVQCFVMEDAFDPAKLLEFTVTPAGLSGQVQSLV
jgi:hypothetical protein